MRNSATLWLAEYIRNQALPVKKISKELYIPEEKLIPETEEFLYAEEFLRLCSYLHVDPLEIPIN